MRLLCNHYVFTRKQTLNFKFLSIYSLCLWITSVKSLSRRENKNPVRQENDRIDTIRHGSASSFGSMSRAFLSEDEFRIGPQFKILAIWYFLFRKLRPVKVHRYQKPVNVPINMRRLVLLEVSASEVTSGNDLNRIRLRFRYRTV